MKILLLSPLPPPAGGIATWTKGYLNSEQAKRNNIDIVNTSVKGKRVNNFTRVSIIDEVVRTFKIILDMKKKLRLNNPDIVHINTSCSKFGMIRDLVCLKLIKNPTTKIIVHCHCDTSFMIKDELSEIIFRNICKKGDKIFSLNSSSYNHIKKITGKYSIIIPNFIKHEEVGNLYKKPIANKIEKILYVGHITKEKGCDDIIDIAMKMIDKKFTMIGYLGDDIKKKKSSPNIRYLGEVSHNDVLSNMKKNDLFLFPTHTEGFPNSVLEAMACGMPIVSTNVGAIPDMLEKNGGITVEPKDQKAMLAAINKLEDSRLREEMSIWNMNKVEKNYTIDKVMNKIFLEYELLF